MQEFYLEVGERIAMLRVREGYSRETLAKLVDISSKFLYEIENGRKGFSAITLCRLAASLNVTSDFLLNGDETCLYKQKIEEVMQHFQGKDLEEVKNVLEAIERMTHRNLQNTR